MRCVPMPTPDPKDPLNLPEWRKWASIITLSVFGALALSAEAIVGALVPIFVLEYAGIDPKILGQIDLSSLSFTAPGGKPADPLQLLNSLGGPPISKVDLISTLPILVNGLASYILVPLSIAYGRRPVILFAGVMAWAGGLWAGFSTSLNSHIVARVFQGFGAGAVEALIPLILQDMLFINQRNKAFSLVAAGQGIFIVAIGVTSPIIVVKLSWRYIYYITSAVGVLAWIAMIFLVPETRWERSREELGKLSPRVILRMTGLEIKLILTVLQPARRYTTSAQVRTARAWTTQSTATAPTRTTSVSSPSRPNGASPGNPSPRPSRPPSSPTSHGSLPSTPFLSARCPRHNKTPRPLFLA